MHGISRIIKNVHFIAGSTKIAPKEIYDHPQLEKSAELSVEEHKEPSSSKGRKKIKMYNIHKANETQEEKRNYCLWLINIVVVILIAILCGTYFVHIGEPFSIYKVDDKLHANILNQNSAIDTTIHSLEQLQNQNAVKILTCLVGPTGVGKTHFINILSQQISSNFIEIYNRVDLPHLCDHETTLRANLHAKLYSSKFFIIVLDDLTIGDLGTLKKFVETIFSIKNTGILILTVFNIETEGCLNNSQESITSTNIIKGTLERMSKHFYYSHFNYLNEDIVKIWLHKALSERKVPLNSHKKIIHRLLDGQDIRCHGLKGLQAKLLLEVHNL
ncbi:uncharacterized protein LOC123310896 isoform X2 [Coccinella septempunctata]|uniref:uncharacterized protein LOC123310896 isoform X2 n=1 Tax=Coccinella septempunctata TaxID=41139 RepID=UPI001D091FC8|nr:uncharacterized protein LOC123310896 isoform X2 [Coccinella septempunctata]